MDYTRKLEPESKEKGRHLKYSDLNKGIIAEDDLSDEMSVFGGNRHSSYLGMRRYEERRSFQGKRENGENVFGNQKKRKWNQ